MKRRSSRALIGLLAVGFVVAAAVPADAIPTFARRYRTSCATCHQAYPRLNAVGESFRLMGYKFVDDERYRKQQPVEMGDEAYKRLWPDALWPSHIPGTSPLAFISRFMVEYDVDGSRPTTWTFLLPEEVELVWAGNLGDNMAFYGDVIFLQKDFGGMDPGSYATLKARLDIQSLFGPERAFNLRIGTLTHTMGLYTARDPNFYGTHFYLYTTWVMPQPKPAQSGLADYKGNYFVSGPQAGIELNGVGRRWTYAVGLVNGDPLWSPSGMPDHDISFIGMSRGSDGGDFYAQLAYKIGGMDLDRSWETSTAETLTTGAEYWRDDSVTLSLWGYAGQASIRTETLDGEVWEGTDDFWRLGAGVQWQYKDLTLGAAYVGGSDDNPYGNLSPESVDSTTWHVEALGFVYPWLMPYARFEALDRDVPTGVAGLDPAQDIERIIAGAKFMIRPNVSVNVEGAYYTEGENLEEGFDQTIFVLLSASF
jgi:hypothetical protein